MSDFFFNGDVFRSTDWRTTAHSYGDGGPRQIAIDLLQQLFETEGSAAEGGGTFFICIEKQRIRGTDVFSLQASKVNADDKNTP